jgi:signal transduction histidine kinase
LSLSRSQSDAHAINETQASLWGGFLCDGDGRIVCYFGESISVSLLVELTESGTLASLIENVRSRGGDPGWEMTVQYEGSASRLVLHGASTRDGMLIFATLTPCGAPSATGEDEEFNRPAFDMITQCPTMTKKEEEHLRFVTMVVHDLKNPISSIIGSCEYLEGYCQDNLDADQLEMIHAIQSAAATLLGISSRISQLASAGE